MARVDRRQRVVELEDLLRESAFRSGLAAFDKTPGARQKKHVLHYTDVEAACSIIQGRRLRLSPDNERSDPLELRYGTQILDEVHSELGDQALFSTQQVNPYAPTLDGTASWGAYIASLSGAWDVPHHWQNFAHGGRGIAVIISAVAGSHLVPVGAGEREYHVRFGPVEYEQKTQKAILERLWRRAIQESTNPDVGEEGARWALHQVLGEVLPFLKHESYVGESEWRLVGARMEGHVLEGATVEARAGNVREYLEAALGGADTPFALTGIVTGPRLTRIEHGRLAKIWGHGIGLSPEPTRSQWAT